MTPRSRFALAGLAAGAATALCFGLGDARAGDALDAGRAPRASDDLRPAANVAREIDDALAAAWKVNGLTPTPRCGDEEFVRRVYLDLVGTIPAARQVESFLEDPHPDKRERLVETLMASPGYARHFADLWSEVLVGSGAVEKDPDFVPVVFRPWLERELAAHRRFPELVREILTATGTPYASPAVNFFGRAGFSATDLAGRTAQAFLGVKIQCAQCHDHPYEDIQQKDFRAMAAFFARMTMRPADIPYESFAAPVLQNVKRREDQKVQELVRTGMTEADARVQVERMRPKTVEVGEFSGDAQFPRRMKENAQRLEKIPAEVAGTTPRFLRSVEYEDKPGATRRGALADWIVNPANPYTSRALANRTWGWLMGRGFVNPVDDFSSVNIASVPAALEVLAKDTAQSGFDQDRVIRVITLTKAYQLSSASKRRDRKAEEFFAVGPLKQCTPQQTFDSLQVALGVVDDPAQMTDVDGSAPSAIEMAGGRFGKMAMAGEDVDRTKVALAAAARSFFQTFDDDESGDATSFEGTIPQGLFLLNSRVVNGLLTNPAFSVVPQVLKDFDDERARIRHLFLRTLSRQPTDTELARFVKFVKSSPSEAGGATSSPEGGKRKAAPRFKGGPEASVAAPYADVLWALVSSSEFGTNH
jgi:uncharacterized protein DUF1549/uncharacterized protein DUF1553